MGRATSGVMGIRLRGEDRLLAMVVANDLEAALMVVTDGGFGKRTSLADYKRQNRGGSGVLTAAIAEKRGQLVGALIVRDGDEVFAVTSSGVVIRVPVAGLRLLSRATGGVKLISLEPGASVVSVARNGEAAADVEQALEEGAEPVSAEVVAAQAGDGAAEPRVLLSGAGELVEQTAAGQLDPDGTAGLEDDPGARTTDSTGADAGTDPTETAHE